MQRSPATAPVFKAILFDFEGTLVDFQWQLEPAHAELRAAIASLGLEGDEFIHGNYATMWNAAADRLEPLGRMDELRAALCPIYDRWDADALTRWSPRPGAKALLQRLATAGLRVGMVSNVGRRALAEALQRFGLDAWLMPVVSRDDVNTMKPGTEGVLRVLAEWQLEAGAVLFVGDSRADVRAARAAGVRVAIIRGGECVESDFAADPPDFMISQLDELAGLIAS
ncbi:MAG: HAD family hydrolase [Rhodocyclaceae bacterium]|nr:HAD family hydrolase [Rhodocyclaceae bacterium]MCB1891151.1 HAD family hydrolase [Rhodocyclaceae bacterium]MCP5297619.1 HAD family hydrolase [Zoogloeaceae bacterium]